MRWGVTANDLTGRKWIKIQCPFQYSSRTSSTISLNSRRSSSPAQSMRSLNTSYKEKGRVETSALIEHISFDEGAAFSAPDFRLNPAQFLNSPSVSSLNDKFDARNKLRMSDTTASSAPTEYVSEICGREYKGNARHPRAWSPVRSVGSMVGTEAHPESDSSVFEMSSNRGSCIFSEEDDQSGMQYWNTNDSTWTVCSAGAVLIEPTQLPNWFKDSSNLSEPTVDTKVEWRRKTIEKLCRRIGDFDISTYEKAIETSSWVKSIEAKFVKDSDCFDECLIELEWLSSSGSGTLTILNTDGVTTKLQISLSDITCIICCSEPAHPRIALYAPRLTPNTAPIKLQFTNDSEMEEWLSHLTTVSCELENVQGKPSNDAIWITNTGGDILTYDPINQVDLQYNGESKLYEKEMDMSSNETPYCLPLPNGMQVGSVLDIKGCIFDDASQVRFDLQCHSTLKARFIVEKMRHVACHLNPRFNEKLIVLNTMENSEWLAEQRHNDMVFAPGNEFHLEIRYNSHFYYQVHAPLSHQLIISLFLLCP